jgi:hypothetical protein
MGSDHVRNNIFIEEGEHIDGECDMPRTTSAWWNLSAMLTQNTL